MRRLALVVAGLTVVTAACSSNGNDTKAAAPANDRAHTMNISLMVTGCDQPTYATRAGEITFVAENTTSRDAEFEILAPGPQIIAEKDPIGAGETAKLDVNLRAGDYELICALGSDAKRSTLTITGKGGGATLKVDAQALDDAALRYTAFVLEQAVILKRTTEEFAAAVEAGNVEQAKALYAPGRIPWETIEPVAELFPEIDGLIDSRVDDHEGPDDPEWTGWHRIEQGLWEDNRAEGLAPFAQQLVSDTNGLVAKVEALTIDPGVMTNGAAALIEEAAQDKITGEEERYSRTDLITFRANINGAKKIIEIITPVLTTAPGGAELLADINEKIAKVETIIAPYKQGNSYVSYDQVNDATRDQLKAAMADLSEELAEVSGTIGLKVQ